MIDLTELISKYNDVSSQITEANDVLGQLKVIRSQLKTQLISAIQETGLSAASAHGKTVKIVNKKSYTIIDPEIFTSLDDKYKTASLFSVNTNKLNSFCKQLEAIYGELPHDIAQSLSAFTYDDISVTKLK